MSAQPSSTIGQMLFLDRPPVMMGDLVRDLDKALVALITPARRLTWPHRHMAVFDFEGGRIILMFDPAPCAPWQGCLTIAVGDGRYPMLGRLARRHHILAHKIVEDISRVHPPDTVRWLTMRASMDPDIITGLVGQLADTTETQDALQARPGRGRARAQLPQIDAMLVAQTDSRASAALDARRAARAEAEAQFTGKAPPTARRIWKHVLWLLGMGPNAALPPLQRRATAFELSESQPDSPTGMGIPAARA